MYLGNAPVHQMRLVLPDDKHEAGELIMGLDLGQAGDPSAAATVKRLGYGPDFHGPRDTKLRVVSLRRWPLGSDYCDVVDQALDCHPHVLVFDFGGVGRFAKNYAERQVRTKGLQTKLKPIQSVASNARPDNHEGKYLSVPKIDLVGALNMARKTCGISLPPGPETKHLLDEMRTFQLKYTAAARQTIDHRGPGHHGDLTMALCLVCWWCLRGRRNLVVA